MIPRTPTLNSRLPAVGTTIFTVMSALAQEHGAVNLGQGFPDFDCDPRLIEAVELDGVEEHETWATEAGPVTYRLVAQEPTAGTTAAVEAGEAPGGLDGAAEATPPHTAPT